MVCDLRRKAYRTEILFGYRDPELVNDVFGGKGTMVDRFENASERDGYRDLYAGVVGVFRNRYAHRLVDPTPEDGGALIVFVNLLLKMIDDLDQELE